jgi:hypothetical protein
MCDTREQAEAALEQLTALLAGLGLEPKAPRPAKAAKLQGRLTCADAVRSCPQIPGAALAPARTYSGQCEVSTQRLRKFLQLNGHSDGFGRNGL